jgi:hypothetical protein
LDSELFLNVADYARTARAKLPADVFDYYEGGALEDSPFHSGRSLI